MEIVIVSPTSLVALVALVAPGKAVTALLCMNTAPMSEVFMIPQSAWRRHLNILGAGAVIRDSQCS